MTATQVLATGLSKSIDDRPLLHAIDLTLEGGLVAILGPNGAGKSTLLRLLATVLPPDDGSLLVDGLDPRHESDRVEVRRRLGYLPQDPGFNERARVFDLLDYIAVLKGIENDRHRKRWVFWTLDRVGLRDRASDRVHELSGGMRRRLGVAQALLGHPTLVLLDEPSAGLDPDERIRLREIVADLRRSATVVLTTHLTEEASYCDTVVVLTGGEVRFRGTPEQLRDAAARRCWVQRGRPVGADAAWQQPDGSYRCVGLPPPGASLVEPTIEDGYLLLRSP